MLMVHIIVTGKDQLHFEHQGTGNTPNPFCTG